jgi:hypothetical protein
MSEHDHGFMELMAADDAWTPHPGDQAQAEQGMAQREHDEDLRRILQKVVNLDFGYAPVGKGLTADELKTLCAAVGVDVRDVT